jgi:hypothetical protein
VLKPTSSFILNLKEHVVDGQRHTYVLDLITALKAQGWRWVEEYIWCKSNPYPCGGGRPLLRFVPFQGAITEPCCGSGAISRVLLGYGYEVESFDLVDRGYGRVQNFLTWDRFCDNVVTNPPFTNGKNIIAHALMVSRRKAAMLLPVRSLAVKRNRPLFRRGLRTVLYLPRRPKFLAGASSPTAPRSIQPGSSGSGVGGVGRKSTGSEMRRRLRISQQNRTEAS